MFPAKVRTPRKPSAKAVAIFLFLIAIPFATLFPYIHTVNNPNENVRVYLTMAIVEHGTFRIDKILERHGYVNDMAKAPDKKTGEAHLYSIKAPAVSFLGVPSYYLFTKVAPLFGKRVPTPSSPAAERQSWFTASVLVMRLFGIQLPAFLFIVFFERWLRNVSQDTVLRLTTVAAVALGTNYLAYAQMFVSHTLFGVTTFASFALITGERFLFPVAVERRKLVAFVAGFFAGFATLLEYQAFPVSCVLAIYAVVVFYRPARLVSFGAGAISMAAALMFYQWRCYGNPLTPGHKMAENPQFAAWHQTGFFGLTTPSWEVFRDLLFSRTYGLFGMSPFFLLGLLAIVFGFFVVRGVPRALASSVRLAHGMWFFAMLALFVPISAAVNWRGGWTLGPRFYGAAPPFFAFGALAAMEMIAGASKMRRAALRGIAGGLALAGVVQIGFVSLVFNTFPETVTRPLTQMAIPLARLGFVPHHAGELIGLDGVAFWFFVVIVFLLAALLVTLPPDGDGWKTYLPRVAMLVVCLASGLYGAFTKPTIAEGGDGSDARAFFARTWEPSGRDLISKLRIDAERHGARGPCIWWRLSRAEHLAALDAESAMHERKIPAGTDVKDCPRSLWMP